MTQPQTTPTPVGTAGGGAKPGATPTVSYPRASRWRDQTLSFGAPQVLPSAGGLTLGPVTLPPYGYMVDLWLNFTVTVAGNATAVTAAGDAPWSLIQSISVNDTNGFPIFGPVSGYQFYLLNKYGGYDWSSDPRTSPNFEPMVLGAGATGGSFSFDLVIPFAESIRDFFCALPNQDGAAAYSLNITTGAFSGIYGVAPSNAPTLTVTGELRSRSVPPAFDSNGNALMQAPIGIGVDQNGNPGASTQFWSRQVVPVNSGEQTPRSTRTGSVIRMIVFTLRTTAGVRDGADWPAYARWLINSNPERQMYSEKWQRDMKRDYGFSSAVGFDVAGGLDTGVYVLNYNNQVGHPDPAELRDFWLPTKTSTVLQLDGIFGSGQPSYNLEILTNDIAPAQGAPISTSQPGI